MFRLEDLKMVDKTQNNGKWVAAVASIIAFACFVGLIVLLSTTCPCRSTKSPRNHSEEVNEIKSKIRTILTTFTFYSTDQEKDFQNKVTKLMLYVVTEENPTVESSMVKTLSKIISEVRKSQVASPVETPNEFQTSSDIAMVNVLETIMNGTIGTYAEKEPLAIEAETAEFMSSIFDVLSVIVLKERDQYMSSVGETDIISMIYSQMATRKPSGKQVPSTVDETKKQIELSENKEVKGIGLSNIKESPANKN